MHAPAKYFEKCLSIAPTSVAVFSGVNKVRPASRSPDLVRKAAALKSWEKTKPTLGWPRRRTRSAQPA